MTKEESIRALIAAGYTLIPLRGKVPIDKDWEKTPPGKYNEKNLTGNYGVLLGPGDFVVDVDPRNINPGDEPLARLISDAGLPTGTLVVRTGGDGFHLYFKAPPDVHVHNALAKYPGIEFKKGPGRQVVGPGSGHVSGKIYEIHKGSPAQIARAPERLFKLIGKKEVPLTSGTEGYQDDAATIERYNAYLAKCGPAIQGQKGDLTTFKAACFGRDLGLSPARTFDALRDVFNVRAKPSWPEDDLRAKVAHAYLYARGAVGSAHPAAVFDKLEGAQADKEAEPPGGWKFIGNSKTPAKCFQNLLRYFALSSTKLPGVFGFNEFTRRVEFVAPAPWHHVPSMNGSAPSREHTVAVQDADLAYLRAYLARWHSFDTITTDIVDAMVDVSQHQKFHPVRDYLNRLKWDGKARLDTWLIDYCGAMDDDPEYIRAVSRKTLCAAVARVFKPGVKFDHVLVMEGPQNIGKSGVCRILGGEWFADFKMDAGEKDTVQMMQGKWIVEMAELHTLRGQVDLDTLKAFLTRQVDEARFAYGRLPGQYPRQGIFIATYNPGPDGTYLKDDTGNRRWWPVRCSGIPLGSRHFNFAGLAAVRDQLFAEAVARYKGGESLTMDTPKLQDAATAAQAERHAEHPWADRIAAWLDERNRLPETRTDFLTSREIFVMAMQGHDSRFSRRDQLDVGRAMRELGWIPGFSRVNGRFIRGYRESAETHLEKVASPISASIKLPIDIFGDLV